MGAGYLMDTNVVIDYLGNRLPESASFLIGNLPVTISVITRIEIVGWHQATSHQIDNLIRFTEKAVVFPLSEEIIQQTILIRQQNKIKLPDAIIAATAIVNDMKLLTHNVRDYVGLNDLKVIDSWTL